MDCKLVHSGHSSFTVGLVVFGAMMAVSIINKTIKETING